MTLALDKPWQGALAVLLASCGPAMADEGGAAFWLSGQYASMSAVPPSPGWSLFALANGYRGKMNRLSSIATWATRHGSISLWSSTARGWW